MPQHNIAERQLDMSSVKSRLVNLSVLRSTTTENRPDSQLLFLWFLCVQCGGKQKVLNLSNNQDNVLRPT